MKNISIILNAVLVVAVLVLFYLQFSGKEQQKNTDKKENHVVAANGEIAYVNIDSLRKNYTFYKDLGELLFEKQQNLEANLNRKMAAYEKEAIDFQEKIQKHLVTQRQAEEMQQKLMGKQQSLLQLKENLSQQLMQDEMNMNKQLQDSLASFFNSFNADKRFKIILSISIGQNILYGDEALDITETVIEGLNERYGTTKKEETEEE